MKSLVIIIGKAPRKYHKNIEDPEMTTWHVDLEINSSIPSDVDPCRQQAFIAFNFMKEQFEIKNLSEKQEIYVNGKSYTFYDDPVKLESNDMVQIGTEDFVFLLPIDSKTKPKNDQKKEVTKKENKETENKDVEMKDVEVKNEQNNNEKPAALTVN